MGSPEEVLAVTQGQDVRAITASLPRQPVQIGGVAGKGTAIGLFGITTDVVGFEADHRFGQEP